MMKNVYKVKKSNFFPSLCMDVYLPMCQYSYTLDGIETKSRTQFNLVLKCLYFQSRRTDIISGLLALELLVQK